jgi:hypothetical protein
MMALQKYWQIVTGKALAVAMEENKTAHEEARHAFALNGFDKTLKQIEQIIRKSNESPR